MSTYDEAELLNSHARPTPAKSPTAPAPAVARSTDTPEHQAAFQLQRLAGNAAVSGLFAQRETATAEREDEAAAGRRTSPVLDVVGKGGGAPLDASLRREMEGALGTDFSNVRLHTDSKASESARAVNANAYTVGNDVVIRNDRYNPASPEGRKTIAHELTHVVQQSSGPVAGRDTGTGIRLSDPSDDFERAAEATAHSVVSSGAAAPSAAGGGAAGGAGAAQLERDDAAPGGYVQREEAPEEEEELQGEFVQREEEEEEEELQGEFVQREGPEDEEEEEQVQGEFVQREATPEEEEEEQAPGGA